MRTFYYILIFSLSCCSCVIGSNKYTCKSLEDILICFIDSNNNYDVYSIYISRIDSIDFINISTSNHYQEDFIDGYFFLKGKLITYYATDCEDRSNIIHYPNTIKFNKGDSIIGYRNSFEGNIEIKNESYVIIPPDIIVPDDSTRKFQHEKKISGINGFNSWVVNKVVNNYINNNPSVMYEINFFQRNKKKYFSIRYAFYYDSRYIDAYFYRDNNLIVLYNIEKLNGVELLKKSELKWYHGYIPNRKEGPIQFWNIPKPIVYEICSIDSIKMITNDDDIFFITTSGDQL